MKLREALDLCSDEHAHEWVKIPSGQFGRPATTMLAGLFDPGMSEPHLRPVTGHNLAVYEPDPSLSLLWSVPDEYEEDRRSGQRELPDWAETDDHTWKSARDGWAVILLNGSPIWQAPIWYIDWGSGIGGYVADFHPRFGDYDEELGGGARKIDGWEASAWAIGLARLINAFSHTAGEFAGFEPTARLVPSPSKVHPVDAAHGNG
jgi:hypothetical protein